MRLRHVLATTLLLAAGPALGQGLNLITGVAVKDEGGTVVLSVTGTKPPNFTTFSMADPPRFVLDLSEAQEREAAERAQADRKARDEAEAQARADAEKKAAEAQAEARAKAEEQERL